MTQINPFSYWEQTLFQMIDVSHPYKLHEGNKDELAAFITKRAQEAKDYYNSQIMNGVDEQQAKEDTRNSVLFTGLLFSPTDFISSFFWHTYQKELSTEERVDMYEQSKHIFEKYSSDNFYAEPDNELRLEEELISFFSK